MATKMGLAANHRDNRWAALWQLEAARCREGRRGDRVYRQHLVQAAVDLLKVSKSDRSALSSAKTSARDRITFRRATTKGKQETRSVPVSPELRKLLEGYLSGRPYLFPGRWGRGHICPESADAILRAALNRLRIEGASTHSFRRTAITWMHNERVPIKHIQSISGHKSLSALQRYIDVTEKDKEMAIATPSFRSGCSEA